MAEKSKNDIYVYDVIPDEVRWKVKYAIFDHLDKLNLSYKYYSEIVEHLKRYYGVNTLADLQTFSKSYSMPDISQILNDFIIFNDYVEYFLDVIELTSLILMNNRGSNLANQFEELINNIFKEDSIGYRLTNNTVIRIDSTILHNEIVKPALELLQNPLFKGVNNEYVRAHDSYKKGHNKECLIFCNNAFESTLKCIFTFRKIFYNETDTLKPLINVLFKSQLIPEYLQSEFSSLRALLESSVSTIRNKEAGHGQGNELKQPSDTLTRYALNLTGAHIIFLVETIGVK